MSPEPAPTRRPVGLVVVAAIEAAEGVGALLIAALALASGPGSPYPLTAYGAGGTLILVALLLIGLALGSLRARPWSLTAGLVWQIVQLLVGLYALQGDGAQPAFAAAAAVPAAAVIVLLFTPPVRDALTRSR